MVDFIENIFNSIKYAVKDIVIFPGENLLESFKYCIIISALSILSSVLKLPTLIDWRGAILSVVLLGAVILIGRRDILSELSRSHGNDSLHASVDSGGQKSTNTEVEIGGSEIISESVDNNPWK